MSTTTRDETTIDRWTKDAQFFEYSKAANPIGSGLTSKVPLADFPHHLHEEGPTRIIPFDLSEQLRCPGPATSPTLCANFIRILAGERLGTQPNATSEVYYVIRGRGRSRLRSGDLPWQEGDFSPCRPEAGPNITPRPTRPSTGSTTSPCCDTWASRPMRPVRADPLSAGAGCRRAG